MKKGVTKKAAAKKAAPKKSAVKKGAVKKGAKTPATTNKLLDKKPSSKKATKKRKPGKSKDEEGGCVSPSFVKTSVPITIETITPGSDFPFDSPARVDIGKYNPNTQQIEVKVRAPFKLDEFGFQVSRKTLIGEYNYPFEYVPAAQTSGFLKIITSDRLTATELRVTILTKKKVAP
jgi:hypothetical protein